MPAPNQYNQRTQNLLDQSIEVFEAVPDGFITGMQVDHPRGWDSYVVTWNLGSLVAKSNVIEAAHAKLGVPRGSLQSHDSVVMTPGVNLCLKLPELPESSGRVEPRVHMRSLAPLDPDNPHVPGFMQASTLVGQLPFEVGSARLTRNAITDGTLYAPELQIHGVEEPVRQVRAAMAEFAQMPGVSEALDEGYITRPTATSELWQFVYAPTPQATVVSAYFHESYGHGR